MSSIFVTALSYLTRRGAGGNIKVRNTSPKGLTINTNEEVFVPGGTSNRSTVIATNAFTKSNTSDLLSVGQNDGTFLSNLGTDTLTRGADGSLFLGTTTSASGRSNVRTDFNTSSDDGIGIVATNNLLNNFGFTGLNSMLDSFL
ncbi:MAG: hypothetical protein RMZ43_017570 [Nostoc sp. CmiVER01]|uniref:hypothetical protein n=1 Tax=Nostoc sp. CmiVER01 TaxID=3075384 RepID=UPI002AD2CDA8|nr:hypothetical protein [Nostoc sp. CmiVER01]MDZ8124358.1 hypothetical protein [Nostoc sp. CmiVER01]